MQSKLEKALETNAELQAKNIALVTQLAELISVRSFSSDLSASGSYDKTFSISSDQDNYQNRYYRKEIEEVQELRGKLDDLTEQIAQSETANRALKEENDAAKKDKELLENVLEQKSIELWTLTQRNEALLKDLAELREQTEGPAEQLVQMQMNLQVALNESTENAAKGQVDLSIAIEERDKLREEIKLLAEAIEEERSIFAAERANFEFEKSFFENSKHSLRELSDKLQEEQASKEKLEIQLADLMKQLSHLRDMPSQDSMDLDGYADDSAEKEKQFFLPAEDTLEDPIVYLELGNFELRLGLWNKRSERFEECFRCPSVVAQVKDRSSAGREKIYDLVSGASRVLNPDFIHGNHAPDNSLQTNMYEFFRETGLFIGNDAQYCLFEHPDPMLRSSLQLLPVIRKDQLVHKEGLEHLLVHALSRGLGADSRGESGGQGEEGRGRRIDFRRIQLLFGFKVCFDSKDLSAFAHILFEVICLSKVCFVNEMNLIAAYLRRYSLHSSTPSPSKSPLLAAPSLLLPASCSSMLIVDIGSSRTHVYPIFEGFAIRQYAKLSEVGGEACSELLRQLLGVQMVSKFSSMPVRRQLSIARRLKEKFAFVAETSFDDAKDKYGSLFFERKNVMHHGNGAEDSSDLGFVRSSVTDETAIIQCIERITAPDGDMFELRLDRERFYCAEVLFHPDLLEESTGQLGLVDLIEATVQGLDQAVRKDICSCIMLSGRSAKIPGLADRLREELRAGGKLQEYGVSAFSVECLEPLLQSQDHDDDDLSETSREADTATWIGADVRMRASLSTTRYRRSPLGRSDSSALSPGYSVSPDDENNRFKKQEFILCGEYQEWGASVVERLLDDCY